MFTYSMIVTLTIIMVCIVLLNAQFFSYKYAEKLLSVHDKILNRLETKSRTYEHLLNQLSQYTSNLEYLREAGEDYADAEEFVSNPIHAFKLMKCLTLDMNNLRKEFEKENISEFSHKIEEITRVYKLRFPSVKDLRGVCQAILRLQDIYALDETSILSGNFRDYWDGSLSENDLIELRNCYKFHKRIELDEWLSSEIDLNNDILLEYYRVIQQTGRILHSVISTGIITH